FNRITKLHQKVGNYPGITVEKRQGTVNANGQEYSIIDLPGTYTLFPNSLDEEVVLKTLLQKDNKDYPELVVVVSEPSTISRGVIIYQQVREIGLPAIFVINMEDEISAKGLNIVYSKLEQYLKTKVYKTNARTGKGIDELIKGFDQEVGPYRGAIDLPVKYQDAIQEANKLFPLDTEYITLLYLALEYQTSITSANADNLKAIREKYQISTQQLQKDEAIIRHDVVQRELDRIITKSENKKFSATEQVDNILLHPIFGYVIFFGILFLIFQAIYSWSGPLMDWVDGSFSSLGEFVGANFPAGPLNDLIVNGIIAGIGGIVIFLPQIIILFLFISLMEETGYMSRVVFLMDRWLKPFGLNGKSVIPLMSGVACAIPAVMSARNIENPKERLLTMLVTPFMTCAARLPIYIVIIGLVIPE